jgi:hypothetical protein
MGGHDSIRKKLPNKMMETDMALTVQKATKLNIRTRGDADCSTKRRIWKI